MSWRCKCGACHADAPLMVLCAWAVGVVLLMVLLIGGALMMLSWLCDVVGVVCIGCCQWGCADDVLLVVLCGWCIVLMVYRSLFCVGMCW